VSGETIAAARARFGYHTLQRGGFVRSSRTGPW
jgi:hypothetical protein